MIENIIKRNGAIEPFTASKLNKWGEWSAQLLGDRGEWSSVVQEVVREHTGTVHSQKLQKSLIDKLLARRTWPSNLMAGRLYAATLRKAFYDESIPTVASLITKLAKIGLMAKMDYTVKELREVETFIDHERDFEMAHFQIHQIRKKYAIQNRDTQTEYETPQFTFMRMALALAEHSPKKERMEHIKAWYDEFSLNRINAPSPNYINLGTRLNGYASCCLYKNGDTVDAILAAEYLTAKMTSMSAGIGGLFDTRTLGDPVRFGQITHNGKMPYIASHGKGIKENIQAGRSGASTVYYTAFDPEADTLARAQNPRTPIEKQNRDVHFAVLFNRLFAKKVLNNEQIFVFTSWSAPTLYPLLFSGDKDAFEAEYNRLDADPNFKKTYVNAREFMLFATGQGFEVATHYEAFIDEINRHTPFREPIHSSNLCVAPETTILTDRGHLTISDLKNQEVNVWNGHEFSTVTVRQTSEKASLLHVQTDSGLDLSCTPDHKWYVVDDYHSKPREARTHELKAGDKLMKAAFPVISGDMLLSSAYQNGFYSGDGCLTHQGQRVYLYGEKRELEGEFPEITNWTRQPEHKRIYGHQRNLKEKFFVPGAEYSIESRLSWLAGLADSDGCIYRNGENQQLVITSVNVDFLKEIQLMLQMHGVSSKTRIATEGGMRPMPANDGTGEKTEYECQAVHQLMIASNELQLLMQQGLGMRLKRLKVTKHEPQRSALHFVKVTSVTDVGREDATYCFTEPKRHLGVFNGLLTGQCLEITEPTATYEHVIDLFKDHDYGYIEFQDVESVLIRVKYNDRVHTKRGITWAGDIQEGDIITGLPQTHDVLLDGDIHLVADLVLPFEVARVTDKKIPGEVALCSLAALVVPNIKTEEQYAKSAYYALKMIDVCIHKSDYPLTHVGYTAKKRMNAAVGMLGIATHMARLNLKYDSPEGYAEHHRIAERHAWYVINASLKIAGERGPAPWIHKTKWVEGWLPIETYKKEVDEITPAIYHYDWEWLRKAIIAMGGIAHSSLIAHMPTESSSKASGAPNCIYPVRDLGLKKSDGNNVVDWVAPDSDIIADQYQLAWDIPTINMIKVYALYQKFADHSISADEYEDRRETTTLSADYLIKRFQAKVLYGVKSRYYINSLTSKKSEDQAKEEAAAGVRALTVISEIAAAAAQGGQVANVEPMISMEPSITPFTTTATTAPTSMMEKAMASVQAAEASGWDTDGIASVLDFGDSSSDGKGCASGSCTL